MAIGVNIVMVKKQHVGWILNKTPVQVVVESGFIAIS
jgi:hypothetical protein